MKRRDMSRDVTGPPVDMSFRVGACGVATEPLMSFHSGSHVRYDHSSAPCMRSCRSRNKLGEPLDAVSRPASLDLRCIHLESIRILQLRPWP